MADKNLVSLTFPGLPDKYLIAGGSQGQLWTVQQVYLLRQVLERLKYDSAAGGVIAEQLLDSLEANPEDQGWSMSEIDLLDSLLDHTEYTDASGGLYADELIASLKGQLVELGGSVTLSAPGTYNVSSYINAVVDPPTYNGGVS